MARPFGDLSRQTGLWLAGGGVAFLAVIGGAALMTAGLVSVHEGRERAVEQARVEHRAPGDLQRVPEIALRNIAPNPAHAKAELVKLVGEIRAKEAGDADGFVKELINTRPEMKGMPFRMGGMCRLDAATSSLFSQAVSATHDALQTEELATFRGGDSLDVFLRSWGGKDSAVGIAALSQIYGPQTVARRKSLADHLQAIDHPASTQALARTAVFDFDAEVRTAAVKGLLKRTKQDYTEILLAGLHHPWPVAAQNAARALAQLKRTDLIPQLVAFLAERDPREPFENVVDGKPQTVVREVVKINHHRNCLLCHPPAPANSPPGGILAVVPTPGESFPTPQPGNPYGSVPSEIMVRADVTYLRQDFSVLQPVAGAAPWPDLQRFDFFVRTRPLTADELRERQPAPAASASPYQKAAALALERLTGKQDIAPTAAAWAEALHMPAP